MKNLRFAVKGKKLTSFSETSISFLRGVQNTKAHSVPYTSGNGYQAASGNTLLTEGVDGQVNHLRIVVNGNQSISGVGNLNLLITRFPNDTQVAEQRTVTLDGSSIKINFTYNSRPLIQDMVIEVENREIRPVKMTDFDGNWNDYDGDPIAYITIYNSDNNLRYNNSTYTPGTPIPVSDITAGKLVYYADDTDTQYNDDYQYTITDSQGNVSN